MFYETENHVAAATASLTRLISEARALGYQGTDIRDYVVLYCPYRDERTIILTVWNRLFREEMKRLKIPLDDAKATFDSAEQKGLWG